MYFAQLVCEGPPNPRAFRKQETPILACFSGKDRFKINFVSSVEDVDIEVFFYRSLYLGIIIYTAAGAKVAFLNLVGKHVFILSKLSGWIQ